MRIPASVHRSFASLVISSLALFVSACSEDQTSSPAKSNILFVIMDDVGIDQMQVFGYGGATPPSMPNIDQIAHEGVRFHNTWAMPACTTSRSVFFDGRFPLRTNVLGALGPDDLANSMVSPFESTAPKVLAQAGYESALFGKFHLGLQGHDPAGYLMPHNLGWNFFAGWLDETGDPSSIDTTAGGVADTGTSYPCGFVPSAANGGADWGACYMPDGSCTELRRAGRIPPGRSCLSQGGILDPNAECVSPPPSKLNFGMYNGHYVSPVDYNFPDGTRLQVHPVDPRARTFRAAFVVDEAIQWIKDRPTGQPWMATVSFASAHTPVMQVPVGELPFEDPNTSGLDCTNPDDQRVLTNQMIESIDAEVGRLLVEIGLATRSTDGALIYHPGQTSTTLIILGDNGTLGSVVKEPFDPTRSKGTAYQTGVWVPLIVAGPQVNSPDRAVNHMVNIADLFELFGEIAGVDVHKAVPRTIDSMAMMPYLTNPDQQSIRTWNFTQVGPNLQAGGAINGPCLIGASCTQIPVSPGVCADNNGTWYGPGATPSFQYCCQVSAYLASQGQTDLPLIQPLSSLAIRNAHYKLVENTTMLYVPLANPCFERTDMEFYRINEDVPFPQLDEDGTNLPILNLNAEEQQNYDQLLAQLNALYASSPECTGDGNIDFVINQKDLDDWRFYNETGGLSSVYDINLDGFTNDTDAAMIRARLGTQCTSSRPASPTPKRL